MPEPTHEDPMAAFGANEWLVDEMRERYDKDPSAVDPAWVAFFKNSGGNGASSSSSTTTAAPARRPGETAREAARSRESTRPRPSPRRRPSPSRRRRRSRRRRPSRSPRSPSRSRRATRADEPTYTTLRGIGAATAKNMDISLSVPTATSVRNIPVKLLWDNRIVINNHLKRARGGKVSFTHLIGYAIVKAIESMPAMNNTYAEVDGKPTMVTPGPHQPRPGDRPAEARRHPSARRPVHQGLRGDGLRALLDGVRGDHQEGPGQQAGDGRLLRHHRQPDQRRRPGHQQLRAAPDGRARPRSSASARWTSRRSSRARPRTP